MPATVGVINGTDSPDPVTVRMMATENGQVIGLREAVLTVPTDRVALLQLTVDGLCLGDASVTSTVSAESASSGTLPSSACGDGLTCILGGCQSNEVDAAGLPTFVATGAFGTSDGGTCFDGELCFHDPATAKYRGYEVVSDTAAGCTIPLPPGASAAQINVGIPTDPSACEYDASPCVIPLVSQIADQAPQVGFHVAGDQIVLPPGLCTQIPAVTEVAGGDGVPGGRSRDAAVRLVVAGDRGGARSGSDRRRHPRRRCRRDDSASGPRWRSRQRRRRGWRRGRRGVRLASSGRRRLARGVQFAERAGEPRGRSRRRRHRLGIPPPCR